MESIYSGTVTSITGGIAVVAYINGGYGRIDMSKMPQGITVGDHVTVTIESQVKSVARRSGKGKPTLGQFPPEALSQIV